MAELKDILAYLLVNYPHKSELSNARVTKMIYLADWRHAIEHHRQVSEISWYFDNYGPFVKDVAETVQKYPGLFESFYTTNLYGKIKMVLKIRDEHYQSSTLTDIEKASLDHVIDVVKKLNWNDFIKLVYSTYPIIRSERHSYINLLDMAAKYAFT